ncbi:MAG: hypothetical protein WBC05_19980 [Sedimentisphaerales bacterium]
MKKQSQYSKGENGVKSYLKGDYEENPIVWAAKNKANSKPIYWRSGFRVQSSAVR